MTQYTEKFNAEIKFDKNNLIINDNKISFSQETDINKINWKNLVLIMFLNALANLILKINYYPI